MSVASQSESGLSRGSARRLIVPEKPPLAAIFGCAGTKLKPGEIDLFRQNNPLGLILFERNCVSPDQVKALTASFRDVVGREDAPVLIDQEGGRVTRLKPPHWRHPPAARAFVEIAERQGCEAAAAAIIANHRLIGADLRACGLTVDCTPVLDVPVEDADPIIGDRALGCDVDLVEALGRAACDGLLEAGVLPVIKHLPGHGRALVDSHMQLPRVTASRPVLEETDFEPFRRLAGQSLGMTAHVIYDAIDETKPATLSSKVISEIIRGHIGFEGLLMSDDLSMNALSGALSERTEAALAAGCDLVLHCNGNATEMSEVASTAAPMTDHAMRRWRNAAVCMRAAVPIDRSSDFELLKELALA